MRGGKGSAPLDGREVESEGGSDGDDGSEEEGDDDKCEDDEEGTMDARRRGSTHSPSSTAPLRRAGAGLQHRDCCVVVWPAEAQQMRMVRVQTAWEAREVKEETSLSRPFPSREHRLHLPLLDHPRWWTVYTHADYTAHHRAQSRRGEVAAVARQERLDRRDQTISSCRFVCCTCGTHSSVSTGRCLVEA